MSKDFGSGDERQEIRVPGRGERAREEAAESPSNRAQETLVKTIATTEPLWIYIVFGKNMNSFIEK